MSYKEASKEKISENRLQLKLQNIKKYIFKISKLKNSPKIQKPKIGETSYDKYQKIV